MDYSVGGADRVDLPACGPRLSGPALPGSAQPRRRLKGELAQPTAPPLVYRALLIDVVPCENPHHAYDEFGILIDADAHAKPASAELPVAAGPGIYQRTRGRWPVRRVERSAWLPGVYIWRRSARKLACVGLTAGTGGDSRIVDAHRAIQQKI